MKMPVKGMLTMSGVASSVIQLVWDHKHLQTVIWQIDLADSQGKFPRQPHRMQQLILFRNLQHSVWWAF
jgi:hypothetical protein